MLALDAAVAESVRRRGILRAYHHTPLVSLANVVRREGLWCRRQLTEWGDSFDDETSKWGRREKAAEFAEYVCCSVRPPMGMLKKEKRPILLELLPTVLALPGVAFIGKWSSFGDVAADQALRQTGVTWFDRMFSNSQSDWPTEHPGEFLVPRCVPLEYVRRIVFRLEDDSRDAAVSLGSAGSHEALRKLRFTVDKYPFGRNME